MTAEQKFKHVSHREPPRRGDPKIRLLQRVSGGNRLLPAFRGAAASAPALSAGSPLEYHPGPVEGSRVSTFRGFDARLWFKGLESPAFCPNPCFACYSSKTTPAMPNWSRQRLRRRARPHFRSFAPKPCCPAWTGWH